VLTVGQASTPTLEGQKLHLLTVRNLLIRGVGKLTTDGDSELCAQTIELSTSCQESPNSLYTDMYALGTRHAYNLGPDCVRSLPPPPATAGGRMALIAYCRGLAEAFQLQLDDIELELETRASAPAGGISDKPDVPH